MKILKELTRNDRDFFIAMGYRNAFQTKKGCIAIALASTPAIEDKMVQDPENYFNHKLKSEIVTNMDHLSNEAVVDFRTVCAYTKQFFYNKIEQNKKLTKIKLGASDIAMDMFGISTNVDPTLIEIASLEDEITHNDFNRLYVILCTVFEEITKMEEENNALENSRLRDRNGL